MRQLTRLRAEMGLAAAQFTARLFPDDPTLAVQYGTVARTCLPDWIDGVTIARPAVPTRGITIRKMALSLGMAAETTRRQVHVLRERGRLVVSDHGVALAPTAENAAFFTGYCHALHDLMIRLIEDLAATCDIDWPVAPATDVDIAEIVLRAIEILLLPIDTFRPARTSDTAFLLWAALTVVAVRSVTYDPVLSRRYANSIPPDDLRADISLRRLAAIIHRPYSTAWRKMTTLHEAGLVTRVGGDQWTVLTVNLQQDSVLHLNSGPSIYLYRKVRELVRLGVDPKRAGGMYRAGRPEPVAF